MSKKVTMHSGKAHADGKTFDPSHNDRTFDIRQADNIDKQKIKYERYWNIINRRVYGYFDKNHISFREAELQYYTESFGHQLEETNAKYVKNGHPERVKSMEEFMYSPRYAPEECYVQIGDSFGHPDMDTFHSCFMEWLDWQNTWNDAHGNPFTILDYAEHFSEEVPQAHVRRVWSYVDENGKRRLGQEKALEMAGVELPETYMHDTHGNMLLDEDNKPVKSVPKRYNNRKMTFDSMARTKWIEIVRAHGIEVDDTPRTDVKHNLTKRQAIVQQLEVAEQDAQKERERVAALQAENDTLALENHGLSLDSRVMQSETDRLADEQTALIHKNSSLKQENTQLTTQLTQLDEKLQQKTEELEHTTSRLHVYRKTLADYVEWDNKVKQFDRLIAKMFAAPDYFLTFLKNLGTKKYRNKDGKVMEITYTDLYQQAADRHRQILSTQKESYQEEAETFYGLPDRHSAQDEPSLPS